MATSTESGGILVTSRYAGLQGKKEKQRGEDTGREQPGCQQAVESAEKKNPVLSVKTPTQGFTAVIMGSYCTSGVGVGPGSPCQGCQLVKLYL